MEKEVEEKVEEREDGKTKTILQSPNTGIFSLFILFNSGLINTSKISGNNQAEILDSGNVIS